MLNFRKTWVRVLLAVLNIVVGLSAARCLDQPTAPMPHSLAQVGSPLPRGAAGCRPVYREIKKPFNAGARGTPLTSCAFVEQVRWTASEDHLSASPPPTQLVVISPTSRKQYEMQCISADSYVTCTGGEDAVVYLYNA